MLRRALIHQSYLNEHGGERHESNERLEFLGDAVLGAVVADALYAQYPQRSEGDLTVMRASLIRRATLARWGRQFDLGSMVLLGRGDERSGGRDRDTLLSQLFEAVIGAVYLERGYEGAREVIAPFVLADLRSGDVDTAAQDPKSRLQQRSHAVFGVAPTYEQIEAVGPDHSPVFTFRVTVGDRVSAEGTGRSKQDAQQQAAILALSALESLASDRAAEEE
jgi:ribonuclease III